MHELARWQHDHDYRDVAEQRAERRTLWVIALTTVTMVVELVAGTLTGSMALLADGWHMATHVGALSIAAFAYHLTRRHAHDRRFTFGTGKVTSLGGYTSAVALGLVALLIAVESVQRLVEPAMVHFREAMLVAWAGLAVNLLSACMLGGQCLLRREAGHEHHAHHHHDHNLRAAYLHVLADALTSVLAIVALWTGFLYGWVWMDPLVGIVGALVIGRWSFGLLRETGSVLVDAEDHGVVEQQIRNIIESDPDTGIADLHIWRVGSKNHACILSLVTHTPRDVAAYKSWLSGIAGLDHITIEVNCCRSDACRLSGCGRWRT